MKTPKPSSTASRVVALVVSLLASLGYTGARLALKRDVNYNETLKGE